MRTRKRKATVELYHGDVADTTANRADANKSNASFGNIWDALERAGQISQLPWPRLCSNRSTQNFSTCSLRHLARRYRSYEYTRVYFRCDEIRSQVTIRGRKIVLIADAHLPPFSTGIFFKNRIAVRLGRPIASKLAEVCFAGFVVLKMRRKWRDLVVEGEEKIDRQKNAEHPSLSISLAMFAVASCDGSCSRS
jgi:hypothetical protein